MPDADPSVAATPMTREEVVAALEAASAQSAVPGGLGEVMEACGSPLARATDVARILGRTPELTATALKLAGSAYFHFPGPLERIEHAVLALGFDEVRNLVITAAVAEALYRPDDVAADLSQMWAHAIGVAIGAEALARRKVGPRGPDAFLAGLLHGIGKAAIARWLPESYAEIAGTIRRDCCLWQRAERGRLDGGHAFVGAWLADRRGMPAPYGQVILHYQAPAPEHSALTHVVHAAEVFARALDLGDAGDPGVSPLTPEVWSFCNMSETMLDDLFDEILDRNARAGALVGLAEGH